MLASVGWASSPCLRRRPPRRRSCTRWIEAGLGGAPAVLAPPEVQALAAARAWQLPLVSEPEAPETPAELVAVEVEYLDLLLSFLSKAARLSLCLPTSKVKLLVGAKPRGLGPGAVWIPVHGGCQQGRELAWRVDRALVMEKHTVYRAADGELFSDPQECLVYVRLCARIEALGRGEAVPGVSLASCLLRGSGLGGTGSG